MCTSGRQRFSPAGNICLPRWNMSFSPEQMFIGEGNKSRGRPCRTRPFPQTCMFMMSE
jgi:hypothetical protein